MANISQRDSNAPTGFVGEYHVCWGTV